MDSELKFKEYLARLLVSNLLLKINAFLLTRSNQTENTIEKRIPFIVIRRNTSVQKKLTSRSETVIPRKAGLQGWPLGGISELC